MLQLTQTTKHKGVKRDILAAFQAAAGNAVKADWLKHAGERECTWIAMTGAMVVQVPSVQLPQRISQTIRLPSLEPAHALTYQD